MNSITDQHVSFIKKYKVDSFAALCIKTGKMEDGQYFCHKGKSYRYILVEEDEENCLIRLKGVGDRGYLHSMDWDFFNEFFIRDEGDFIKVKEMIL